MIYATGWHVKRTEISFHVAHLRVTRRGAHEKFHIRVSRGRVARQRDREAVRQFISAKNAARCTEYLRQRAAVPAKTTSEMLRCPGRLWVDAATVSLIHGAAVGQ
jgi:hypothetical protein